MSNLHWNQPVYHIPSFNEWAIRADQMVTKLLNTGIGVPLSVLDSWYYYTDLEGWNKVLSNLMFNSSLYKPDKFDCDNYALKAMNTCAERYGLNTMAVAIGETPKGRHAFNLFYFGDDFLLWEPNEGFEFSGSPFEIGDFGYVPEMVII